MGNEMSRFHFINRARDSYGNIKAGVGISVYLAGTTTPATVYTALTGGTGISTVPQVLTDSSGLYSFYIDDTLNPEQLYDLVVAGITYPNIGLLKTFEAVKIVGDYSSGTSGRVVNIYYGTSETPPDVTGIPDGSLYIQYVS